MHEHQILLLIPQAYMSQGGPTSSKKNEKNEETSRKIVTVLLSFEQTKQSNCGPLLSTVKLRLEGKGRKEGLAHLILKTEL